MQIAGIAEEDFSELLTNLVEEDVTKTIADLNKADLG
jgi:hypothetical protein